ncbi:alpha/beta hydrolase [Streptomyces lycii]|uniref:Alpha/beta hydrolase n=1 Tax=Streptomyces lycii TaxID=2654337 RepID=A0ABQ7FEY2_9ACTN|nr:alpha/beta hydrolase [Streptomyces lycii]KAF4405803.1 alpha/beta hydrolase [Streptomyces lycii]
MTRSVRAGALLAAAALLAVATTAGCQSGSEEPKAKASSSAPAADGGARQPALPAELTGQKPDWKTCPPPSAAEGAPAGPPGADWQCAELKAPLDYRKPDGKTIDLAMIRSKARDKGDRIGSLLFNFGGPGGSGVSALPGSAEIFRSLSDRYDLVSFDPRGVARSSGVVCRDDRAAAAAADLDHTPDDAAEEKAFLADARSFAAGCERRSGAVLPHVSTEDAARDMDLMREVLGDDKLNYFGFSYGTELGGTYAHLFPGNVGRMVLDAVVDPSADDVKHALNQATGFQRALENYLADCASKGASCPTGADPDAGVKKITGLLERLDGEPLPTSDDGRKLTENQALTGIVMSLYNESSWQYLTQGLREAFDAGTGDLLLTLADQYNERGEDGSYGTQAHSQRAISCADSTSRLTAAEAKKQLPEFREVSPVFGAFLAWDLAGWCADWPVRGTAEHAEVSAEGAAPILVVGTTGDPATPYEGARIMADELGEDVGVHLTYEGEGHGAYMTGNPCTQRTIDAYLLKGEVPEDGKTCT